MVANTIINHDTFKQIVSYNPTVTGKYARNHMKMEMFKTVITSIGEK